ncbi:MAG TPA: ester cyclase [Dehalococcoidia bacterium]|jgi:steroid delta-isomerase-like uncharacterized protein
MSFAQQLMDAWNTRKGENVAGLMAPDAVFEDFALGVVHHGRDEIAAFVAETVAMSADVHFELVSNQETMFGYCVEWVMKGTHTGPAAGIPATNKPFAIPGVSVGVLEGGLVKQNHDYWNMAAFLAQLGLMPAPPPSAG